MAPPEELKPYFEQYVLCLILIELCLGFERIEEEKLTVTYHRVDKLSDSFIERTCTRNHFKPSS